MNEKRKKALEFVAWQEVSGGRVPGERVMVIRDETQTRTNSGLYIPDQAQRKPGRGIVVGIGGGVDLDDPKWAGITIGSTVLFNSYNVVGLSMTDKEGSPVRVSILHNADVYYLYREVEGVDFVVEGLGEEVVNEF